jgi:hypothetical protein|nr:hypothetical protein [uncultured Campylobacter sp.]
MQTNQEVSQMSHTALTDALIGANEIIEDLSSRLDRAEQELKTAKEQNAKLGEINSRYQFIQLALAQYREGLISADDFAKKITAYDDKGWEIAKGASNE